MNPASNLITSKIGGVNSVAAYSQAARSFVPDLTMNMPANDVDQFGRFGGIGSLSTLTVGHSSEQIIFNENSLRPVLASNPLYKNIQSGIGGGADTLFGLKYPNRNVFYGNEVGLKVGQPKWECSKAVAMNPTVYGLKQDQVCTPVQQYNDYAISSLASGKHSDNITYVPLYATPKSTEGFANASTVTQRNVAQFAPRKNFF